MGDLGNLALLALACLVAIPLVAIIRRSKRDAVAILTLFVALLMLIPAQLVVRPIGAAGTPAMLLGLAIAWWWVAARLSRAPGLDVGPQPVRFVVLIHGWFMLLTYGLMHLRPLTELELSGAHRALISLVAMSGVALLAADGIPSLARLDVLLRRVVGLGSVVAGIGIIQFFTNFDPVRFIRIPGLHANHEIFGIGERSLFNRPFSTTLHPIEFSVVLAILLPLALHYALFAQTRSERRRWWPCVALIAAAIPMSLSRSGVLGLVAAMGILAIGWSWRRRVHMAIGSVAFTGVMWAAVPGLIGTIRSLFTGWEQDVSIQARTDRVPRVLELLMERPWFGHGLGTFSVEEYLLLDNQYYVSAIEVGILGLVVIFALLSTGVVLTVTIYRLTADQFTRHLALALAAGVVVVLLSIATFDAFFYRIFTGLMFLWLGCLGALWRITLVANRHAPHLPPREDARQAGKGRA